MSLLPFHDPQGQGLEVTASLQARRHFLVKQPTASRLAARESLASAHLSYKGFLFLTQHTPSLPILKEQESEGTEVQKWTERRCFAYSHNSGWWEYSSFPHLSFQSQPSLLERREQG